MWSRFWSRAEPGESQNQFSEADFLAGSDPERPPTQPIRCTESGCNAQEGWACGYRDRWGKDCGTWWCDEHVDFIGEMAFCRRHGSVMRALANASTGLHDVKTMPSVEDRSLSLVSNLGHELEEPMLELLRRRFGDAGGVQVLADRSVRAIRPGPTRLVWERGWGAVKSVGFAGRVAIRVPVGEDPVVHLYVDGSPVLKTIPDWIQRRIAGEPPDDDDHANFKERILEAADKAFDSRPKPATLIF
jgi:hypothetical protein